MKKIIILGGRGDGESLVSFLYDLQESGRDVAPIGFLNDSEEDSIMGLPVLGKIDEVSKFFMKDIYFMSALLSLNKNYDRANKIRRLSIFLERYFTIIHPSATVSKFSSIGYGTLIGPHVNIMPNVVVGNHSSLRATVNIGHDSIVDDYVYIGPHCTVSGKASIGIGAYLSLGISVGTGVSIGKYSTVGLGSVVLEDIPEFKLAYGCPAKIIRDTQNLRAI